MQKKPSGAFSGQDTGRAGAGRPGLRRDQRGGIAPVPSGDPEEQSGSYDSYYAVHHGKIYDAGQLHKAEPGAVRDVAGEAEAGVAALGAGQDPHRHGSADAAEVCGAAPDRAGGDRAAAGRCGRIKGRGHQPGGDPGVLISGLRPGTADHEDHLRHRQSPGSDRIFRFSGNVATCPVHIGRDALWPAL